MTWDAYHRRKALLREVLGAADRNPDLTLTDLLDATDPKRSVFTDETAALFEIQMAWSQRLSGLIDRLASDGCETPEMAAVAAWAAAAAQMPGARRVLDAHHDNAALAKAFAKERAFLADSAGVPAQHVDRDGHGERMIDSARGQMLRDDAPRPAPEPLGAHQRQGLIARLRSVIAA